MKKQITVWVASLGLLAVISCNKQEVEPPLDCGCDSDSIGYTTNMLGSYGGDKTAAGFVLFDSMGVNHFLIVGLCEVNTTLENSPDSFIYNYKVSGVLKKKCPYNSIESSPSWYPVYKLTNPVIVKLKTPYQL